MAPAVSARGARRSPNPAHIVCLLTYRSEVASDLESLQNRTKRSRTPTLLTRTTAPGPQHRAPHQYSPGLSYPGPRDTRTRVTLNRALVLKRPGT